MKKMSLFVSLAVMLGLVLGCPQPNDSDAKTPAFVFEDYTTKTAGIGMVAIPGGTFTMGQLDPNIGGPDVSKDEQPVRSVTLDRFMLGSTEITQGQWERVMQNKYGEGIHWPGEAIGKRPNPGFKQGDDYPAYFVS